MDLRKMLEIAGLGCSDGCHRLTRFLASLDEEQCNDLKHLLLSGADRRLNELKAAAGEESHSGPDESFMASFGIGNFAEMFEDPRTMDDATFARRTIFTDMLRKPRLRMSAGLSDFLGQGRGSFVKGMLDALRQAQQQKTEPYSGDLTPEQIAAIAS